jgi:nucleoside-diphosphate-sugar epimerase
VSDSFWTRKNVLVGGGCGFMGSYVVPQLVGYGARVTVADNLDNGYADRLEPLGDAVRFIVGDLRDRAFCDHVIEGQQIVLNLAAQAYGMAFSQAHHGEMLVDNLLVGLVPLDAARRHHVERYLVVSSSCVYPDDAQVPTPELPVFTGLPESVNEGYGWAKRMQELAATYYARQHAMKIAVVRPFNLYGANYRWKAEDKAHVVPALVKRVLDREDPLVVWGSGRQRRNLLHGTDAATVILRIVERSTTPEPVNIGYDDDTPVAELVHTILDVTGLRPRIVFDTTRPEGSFRKCADASRLRQLTGGFVPKVSLRQGIEEMVQWYRRSFPERAARTVS